MNFRKFANIDGHALIKGIELYVFFFEGIPSSE